MSKNLTFFREEEDLLAITERALGEHIQTHHKIAIGWTNIVLEVVTDQQQTYIVRFPRTDYFAQQMSRDVAMSHFLWQQLGLPVPHMELYHDAQRPYSIHKKLPGDILLEREAGLDEGQLLGVAEDIAQCFATLHNVPLDQVPPEAGIHLSQFVRDLPKLTDRPYDYSLVDALQADEAKELVLVYGDLNVKNILLNREGRVSAFLDFAFMGLSDRHADLSRPCCLMGPKLFQTMLECYERLTGYNLQPEKIERNCAMWRHIEQEYIAYMQRCAPEVTVAG